MSDIATRGSAPRSRGSFRGGRGGHSSRGGRGGSRQTAETAGSTQELSFEDQGEIGQLKSKYASSVKIAKEMFPDWTNEDIVFALEENGGDLEQTINRITEGNVSQWGEVKKKDKVKTVKSKDGAAHEVPTSGRAGRGRGGAESTRGGRGRVTERGRGVSRGARGGSSVNGKTSTAKASETPSADAPLAELPVDADTTTEALPTTTTGAEAPTASSPANSWEVVTPADAAPPAVEAQKIGVKPDGTRTWASMLKPAPKPKPVPTVKPKPPIPQAPEPEPAPLEPVTIPEPTVEPTPEIAVTVETVEQVHPSTSPSLPPSEGPAIVVPSEDKLTEENLEQVKDVSQPVGSETVASTVGTEDPRSVAGTPLHGKQPIPVAQPVLGGFATTALKATQGGSRAPGHQRKVKEQQEAVVMPKHAVDRTAVQFGSLNLGSADDVDDEREEAETRAQPPQHSPIAPRASLPLAPAQAATETAPAPRPAPGLSTEQAPVTQADIQPPVQSQAPYDQLSNRFGGLPGAQGLGGTNVSKPYEPFGQQLPASGHHPFENYSSQSQAPGQQTQAAQSYLGGFGSEYGSYGDYQRNSHLYGGFGQQPGQTAHDASAGQRVAGVFGGSSASEQQPNFATSHGPNARYGASETLNSGHSTPAPGSSQPGQSQTHGQSHHPGSHSHQGGQYGPYGAHYGAYNSPFSYGQMTSPSHHQPYGRDRPAFDDARRYDETYMSQNQHYGYAGYGSYGSAPYAGKYAQPQQYGISPQASYDTHGGSQANAFGRESGPGAFGGYGRAGSAQPESAQQGQHGISNNYGAMEAFARTASGYGSQAAQQQGQPGTSDDSTRFGADAGKIGAGGPSPAPNQQRPGSATNNAQAGPGSQPQGQGYGSYPHSNLGGFGAHHQGGAGAHQAGYGGFGGYGNYYGSGNRGGWGGYGGH